MNSPTTSTLITRTGIIGLSSWRFTRRMRSQNTTYRFTDQVHVHHRNEGVIDDNSLLSEPHSLRPGWNNIRLVVDAEASTITLYTNNDLIMTIDDALVEKTIRVEFNNSPTTASVIDNFLLQSGVERVDIGIDEETADDTPAEANGSDDQKVLYFNNFNDYDLQGLDIDLGAEIANCRWRNSHQNGGPT